MADKYSPTNESEAYNRRDFLKSSSFATLMTMLGGVPLYGQTNAAPSEETKGPVAKLKTAVIGLGTWGREILNTLGRLLSPDDIAAICDTYAPSIRRSAGAAPRAATTEDYKTILDNKDIKAVIIATPSHQHKEIALAALKAGKHVYCEAPLANSIEDAREIALAARAAEEQIFQPGLQLRADPQRLFLLPFIRSGALGKNVMARAQWNKKWSWRATSPNAEHEKALNWRLSKATSTGLMGEIGMHQIDQACWLLKQHPIAVTGFGSIALYTDDGRDVPDTIHAVFEFPGGVCMTYDCTLANSFDADYEIYYGSDAAVMLRESKAWMFKEVDSPLLSWEVYCRKDIFYKETGIALVAGGSKQTALAAKATAEADVTSTPLYAALETFLRNAADMSGAREDFVAMYGSDDRQALREHLTKTRLQIIQKRPAASFLEGYQAAVTAIKANDAILSKERLAYKQEWYEI